MIQFLMRCENLHELRQLLQNTTIGRSVDILSRSVSISQHNCSGSASKIEMNTYRVAVSETLHCRSAYVEKSKCYVYKRCEIFRKPGAKLKDDFKSVVQSHQGFKNEHVNK